MDARLADVLGALSFATDLAAGVPVETSIRTCAIATEIARALGLSGGALADAYFTALLRHLGCTSFAHEAAALAAGDDHDLLRTFEDVEPHRRVRVGARAVRRLASGAPIGARVGAVARALATPSAAASLATAQCDQAAALASDLAMGEAVVRALGQIYERFDGRGAPRGIGGDALEPAARVLHVANVVEINHRQGGRTRAVDEVRRRRGGHLDPRACDAFLGRAAACWSLLDATSVWDEYLAAEPAPARTIDGARLDAAARAFARYADLKSPSRIGHSTGVAALAVAAAEEARLSAEEIDALRRAALLHDLGVVSVPNGVWEKRGPLTVAEWERVRLHAYYTQRILARVPALAPAAAIAAVHHERADGSGYPSGAAPPASARAARILACADVYRALVEPRPHRAAHAPADGARILEADARAGKLCARAAADVLAAAGHAPRDRAPAPGGLTARESEVLVHLARGGTNKEIATALAISPRTVQHHVEHIYAKLGVSTRAAAALFAARHDLVGVPG